MEVELERRFVGLLRARGVVRHHHRPASSILHIQTNGNDVSDEDSLDETDYQWGEPEIDDLYQFLTATDIDSMFSPFHQIPPLIKHVISSDHNVHYVAQTTTTPEPPRSSSTEDVDDAAEPASQPHRAFAMVMRMWLSSLDEEDHDDDDIDDRINLTPNPQLNYSDEFWQQLSLVPIKPPPTGHLIVNLVSANQLEVPALCKYKNNLACTITVDDTDYLVVAVNSALHIHEFSAINHMPHREGHQLETRPRFTTTMDSLVSTWQTYPHTFNYIRAFPDFNGSPVVVGCMDDANVYMYNVSTIVDSMRAKHKSIKADYTCKTDSSCWGVDVVSYSDKFGKKHDLMVVSDNSRSLKLLYYSRADQQFSHCRSYQLGHNIPSVAFCGAPEITSDGFHRVKVACGLISKEVVQFEFNFIVAEGPQPQWDPTPVYYVDGTMQQDALSVLGEPVGEPPRGALSHVIFDHPQLIARVHLDDHVWGVMLVESRHFVKVNSITEVYGESPDPITEAKIVEELKLIDSEFNAWETDLLGPALIFQSYRSPRYCRGRRVNFPHTDGQYRCLHKLMAQHILEPPLPYASYSFLVTTAKALTGLFNQSHLYCNHYIPQLLNPASIRGFESHLFTDRLLLYVSIPELLCCLVATQHGLVQVVRMCQYRGVYGLRPETVVPTTHFMLALASSGCRTLAGLTVRNRTVDSLCPTFLAYLIYSDGLVVTYTLRGGDPAASDAFEML